MSRKSVRRLSFALIVAVASYFASSGPFYYLVGRGCLPPRMEQVGQTFYCLVHAVCQPRYPPGRSVAGRLCRSYTSWWYNLGYGHSGKPLGNDNGVTIPYKRPQPHW